MLLLRWRQWVAAAHFLRSLRPRHVWPPPNVRSWLTATGRRPHTVRGLRRRRGGGGAGRGGRARQLVGPTVSHVCLAWSDPLGGGAIRTGSRAVGVFPRLISTVGCNVSWAIGGASFMLSSGRRWFSAVFACLDRYVFTYRPMLYSGDAEGRTSVSRSSRLVLIS